METYIVICFDQVILTVDGCFPLKQDMLDLPARGHSLFAEQSTLKA